MFRTFVHPLRARNVPARQFEPNFVTKHKRPFGPPMLLVPNLSSNRLARRATLALGPKFGPSASVAPARTRGLGPNWAQFSRACRTTSRVARESSRRSRLNPRATREKKKHARVQALRACKKRIRAKRECQSPKAIGPNRPNRLRRLNPLAPKAREPRAEGA